MLFITQIEYNTQENFERQNEEQDQLASKSLNPHQSNIEADKSNVEETENSSSLKETYKLKLFKKKMTPVKV